MDNRGETPTVQGVPEPTGQVLTKEDLARRWKISGKILDRFVHHPINGVRHFMVGRFIRFRLRDVEDFEQKHLTRMRLF